MLYFIPYSPMCCHRMLTSLKKGNQWFGGHGNMALWWIWRQHIEVKPDKNVNMIKSIINSNTNDNLLYEQLIVWIKLLNDIIV